MCCLRYEHAFYVQSRKRFPKEGRTLITSVGEEMVVLNDIFRDCVTLRTAEGETRIVPLAELKRELERRRPFGADRAVEDTAAEEDSADVPDADDVAEDTILEADDAPHAHVVPDEQASEPDASETHRRHAPRRRGRRGGRRHRSGGEPTDDSSRES
jgi:hypothetical protein